MFSSNSTTPTTTPSSNSSSNVTHKVRIYPMLSDASPLFTKDQQIIIQRTKAQLEMEIASLKKRKQILSDQLAHIRSDFISYGELIHLKASIELNHSSMNSQEIDKLMSEYLEIIQENYELSAECEILAKRIKKVTKRRQKEIHMQNQISEIFDFSSLSVNLPNINEKYDISKDNLLKTEIEQLSKKLEDLKKEQMKLDIQVPSTNLICETIGSYTRKTETEWQVRSIGSNIIRTQIKNLQKQVIESTSFLNKIANSLMKDKEKLALSQLQNNEAVTKAKSRNDINKLEFEDQLNQMDQTILQIKKNIERSISEYDNYMEDIKNLFDENQKIRKNSELETSDTYNEEDTAIIDKSNQFSEEYALAEKKKNLEKEINNLKIKYQNQKSSIQKKEFALKQKVARLSNQYTNNKIIIGTQAKILSLNPENPIEKKVSSLINHIDSTILELRSTYA